MAAGVSDHLWEVGDIVNLVEDAETKPGKYDQPGLPVVMEAHGRLRVSVHVPALAGLERLNSCRAKNLDSSPHARIKRRVILGSHRE